MELLYTVFKTRFGWCGVVGSSSGVVRIFLPENAKKAVTEKILTIFPSTVASFNEFCEIRKSIQDYFRGQKPYFDFKLDFSETTDFQKNVWKEVQKIPYGQTRTYSWIAENLKNSKAARAVGTAVGKNPFPIVVPCHRVLRNSGDLGGFSAVDGVELKKRLLMLEGN